MIDKSLLLCCNFTDNVNCEDYGKLMCSLKAGRWKDVINHEFAHNVLHKSSSGTSNGLGQDNEELQTATAFLFAFIQSNFTGPEFQFDSEAHLVEHGLQGIDFRRELAVDGEDLNVNVKQPELLAICKRLVRSIEEANENNLEVKWWKLRLTCIHQQVMDELCNTLYLDFKKCAEWLHENISSLGDKELEALLMIEIAGGYLLFHRTQKCESFLERVCNFLDVELKVEGLLGVRTKFQQKPLPQLCMRVERASNIGLPLSEQTNGKTELPKLLKLDDDVRLEKIQFSNPEDNAVMTLPSLIQCLVFTKLKYIFRSQPKDRLSEEEIEPYITALLYQTHGPLSVRYATLLQNVNRESNSSRTVERCLKQCEEVLMLINSDSKYEVTERLSYFFASMLPPVWNIRKQLGDLMLSLGLVKTALDAYLNIQSWEDVIFCYNRLELRHKAAEIIRQELDKQPTVVLYCLLGDATDDVECYEQAWNFSNHTSSRAQRHWGNFYYFKKNYEDAIPHLQKSLEINALQETTLLRLGYAAIQLEKWDLAAQSYLRYTHLEQRGFESWNNLAKALIKLGDKHRAHKILNEALKCNYNNWKVWENFLVVSVDTGNFEDVINAYQRLVELKEKYLDVEVLEIVVKAIADNIPDSQGRPSTRLKKKMNNLLAHQCVQYANEAEVWQLSALLAENELSRAQKLQKAYRAYVQANQSWVNTKELRMKVLNVCKDICISSLNAIDDGTVNNMERSAALSQLSSARLSVRATIKAVENLGSTFIEDWEQCKPIFEELKTLIETIQSKAETLHK